MRQAARKLRWWLLVWLALVTIGGCRATDRAEPAAEDSVPATQGVIFRCPQLPDAGPPVKGGLPAVELPCMAGPVLVKLSDLRGKPLVVNVWAQWCGPCRDEAPYFAATYRKAGDQLSMLGVVFADPRPKLSVAFAKEHGLRYPHVYDFDKELGPALRLTGPPATVFVAADGRVVHVHRGPIRSAGQLERLVADKLGVSL